MDLQFYSKLDQVLEKIIREDPSFSSSPGRDEFDNFSQAFQSYVEQSPQDNSQFEERERDWNCQDYHSGSSKKTAEGSSQDEDEDWSPISVNEDIILRYTRQLKEQEEERKVIHLHFLTETEQA